MSEKSEIEKLSMRVQRIEDFLYKEFSGPSEQEPQQRVDWTNAYELLDLGVRKSDSAIGPEYSYKLTVRNKLDVDLVFQGKIIFLDSEDYEVTSGITEPFTVKANSEFTKSGMKTILEENHAHRIVDVAAEIYPL